MIERPASGAMLVDDNDSYVLRVSMVCCGVHICRHTYDLVALCLHECEPGHHFQVRVLSCDTQWFLMYLESMLLCSGMVPCQVPNPLIVSVILSAFFTCHFHCCLTGLVLLGIFAKFLTSEHMRIILSHFSAAMLKDCGSKVHSTHMQCRGASTNHQEVWMLWLWSFNLGQLYMNCGVAPCVFSRCATFPHVCPGRVVFLTISMFMYSCSVSVVLLSFLL